MPLAPPEERSFQTEEELMEYVHAHALAEGYHVSKKRTAPLLSRMDLQCDRGGSYQSALADESSREGHSRKVACPFHVYCKKYKNTGLWTIVVKNAEHNHPVVEEPRGPTIRRLDTDELRQVATLSAAGVPPIQIRTHLMEGRDDPNRPVELQDVYNAKAKLRREFLDGRNPIQALLDCLAESNYHHNHATDSTGQINLLAFSAPKSLQLLAAYPHTLILDCTYKTNRYKMPLLHFVGFTATKRSFSAGFCFMSQENEESYSWALKAFKSFLHYSGIPLPQAIITDRELALMKAIKKVFDKAKHGICTWHINKDVLAKFKIFSTRIHNWDWEAAHEKWNAVSF